jgi:hypothetical protein
MPQVLRIPVRGLFTAPNSHDGPPKGALVRADNIVLSREGIAEVRRGQKPALTGPVSAIFPYQDRLLLHSGSTLSYTDTGVTASTPYAASISAAPGRRLHAAAQNENLYLATSAGTKRLDSVTGSPVDAGVPMGLDVQGALTGASGFMPNDSAVAYRAAWGLRDAHDNLLIGAPSGRTIVVNSSGGTRDVSLSTSIPSGLTPAHFLQVYRTAPSIGGASVDPGDEMGLVYEGAAPATASVTQLSRTTNVVTATTAAAHGFTTGQIVRVGPGGSAGGHAVAIGVSAAIQRTTDNAATWSAAGITGLPVGTYNAITSKGDLYVAVGASVCATSPDGLTWTSRTIPAGTYNAISWSGTRFVAVGAAGVYAYSADGIAWTGGTLGSSSYAWRGIAWDGSKFLATGELSAQGCASTSSDGITWNAPVIVSGAYALYGVVWTGTRFVTGGRYAGKSWTAIFWSSDGAMWSAQGFGFGSSPFGYRSLAWTGSALVAVGGGTGATVTADFVTFSSVSTPATYSAVAWDGVSLVAVGASSAGTANAAGTTWTARTIGAGAYSAVAPGGGAYFPSGEKTLTGTPASSTFTYAETGTDGALTQAQTAVPLTATITDQIPSTFSGATLYTSQSQDGILAAAFEPPASKDVAAFRGSLFWLNNTSPATLDFWLLAAGAPLGVQNGDTITVNGLVFTAGASENIATRTFQAYTDLTPPRTATMNVRDTAASLMRILNRSQGSAVYARDNSGTTDVPGRVWLTARTRQDSITLAVSRSSSWAFTAGLAADPKTQANELRWSPARKPDANPITNYQRIGDSEGYRVHALRDSLFVLKEDGVWRVTGDNAQWVISPFDTTTKLIGPETSVVLDNTIFALSTKGVVQISDTGVTVLSKPIEDQINRLLAEPLLTTTKAIAHAVAYEAEGKFILWAPADPSETEPSRAFVYDHFASLAGGAPVWTTRTDAVAAAVVNPYDGKLYTGNATALYRERKALDYTDFADGEVAVTVSSAVSGALAVTLSDATGVTAGDMLVLGTDQAIVLDVTGSTLTLDRAWFGTTGAAVVYKAIPAVLEFAPIIPAPGGAARFHEAVFLFRHLAGGYMTAEFATELTRGSAYVAPTFPAPLPGDTSAGYAPVAFYGTRDYELSETDLFPVNLRTWLPKDQSVGSRLMVRFNHAQARSPMALEGLSVQYTPTTLRLRR